MSFSTGLMLSGLVCFLPFTSFFFLTKSALSSESVLLQESVAYCCCKIGAWGVREHGLKYKLNLFLSSFFFGMTE